MARCGSGTCVEVTETKRGVVLTSTTAGNDGAVFYTHDEWEAFLERVKNGDFDAVEAAVA